MEYILLFASNTHESQLVPFQLHCMVPKVNSRNYVYCCVWNTVKLMPTLMYMAAKISWNMDNTFLNIIIHNKRNPTSKQIKNEKSI